MIGIVERRGRFWTAQPFFEHGRGVNLDKPRSDVRVGDLVEVVSPRPGAGHGKILRRIGRPDVARDVIEAFMLERGLRRRFDPLVEREARAAAEEPPGAEPERREDLRALPTFTIDPPTAKDFDDAISAEDLGGGVIRVWVHIADVSAHVRPGSAVDREAYRRGTSTYVPGAVEPMLPEALSNRACSLVPGQDRLTVTVVLDFKGDTVVKTAFQRSVIRSDARLTYPEVDEVFAGRKGAEEPWAQPLALARQVAAALAERRAERGALVVTSSEPEFSFDGEGHVSALAPSEATESHAVIEFLMIAANEAVAGYLETQKLHGLYRIHEQPDPQRIERLVEQLAALGVATPPVPTPLSPSQALDLVGEISQLVDNHVKRTGHGRAGLTSLVLRSLKQARYSPENKGHAGLRSPRYCHFTSPIRRYPDLVCHRALLAGIGHDESAPPGGGKAEEAGEWCSERERFAMSVERTCDDIARCFLLEAALFERGWDVPWEGEVTGVIGAGVFVAFEGFEGLLPVRKLRGDWWELDEHEVMLIGAQGGGKIRVGDRIVVRVERVEAPRGRVTLSPVELPD